MLLLVKANPFKIIRKKAGLPSHLQMQDRCYGGRERQGEQLTKSGPCSGTDKDRRPRYAHPDDRYVAAAPAETPRSAEQNTLLKTMLSVQNLDKSQNCQTELL